MYKVLIRPLFFLFDAERIHHFVFNLLKIKGHLPGFKTILHTLYTVKNPSLNKQIFGLSFENPVGLAAGFDKDAKLIDELAAFGFGFIEIGTLTPRSQPGNDKPRLFRLPADQALINRMGFNNGGVDEAVSRLKKRTSKVIVGGNIGKNKVTPNAEALSDYIYCINALYDHVDYFVVNVSSPNTPGLRELQEKEPLRNLLLGVKSTIQSKPKYKPVLLKIAPDLTQTQLNDIVEILTDTQLDGVIATNTTIDRSNLSTSADRVEKIGAGGLSGKPLTHKSNEVIRYLREKLGKNFPIIGVGGIMNEDDAVEKLKAGADLIQLYTGFVYEGPGFVKRINKRLLKEV